MDRAWSAEVLVLIEFKTQGSARNADVWSLSDQYLNLILATLVKGLFSISFVLLISGPYAASTPN